MRTIRFIFKPEQSDGTRMEFETEVIVSDEDEARIEGKKSGELISKFMEGLREAEIADD